MSNKIHEDLGKVSKKLMFAEAFYGLFLISLNKEVSDRISTACVSKNGINVQLTINPEYWEKLEVPKRIGLLKHEVLHIAFQHLDMMHSFSDKKLFNIAADCEINQYISAECLPDGAILPGTFPELNLEKRAGTKYYYNALLDAAKNNTSQALNELMESMDGNTPYDHELWKEFQNCSEAEKDLIRRQVDYQLKEIYEATKGRGTIPGELDAYLKGLYVQKEAVFNWKEYLRRFISGANKYYTKKTRRKLNKRFIGNPAIKIKPKARILIGIDTSGSVSEQELLDFFSEIYHVYKTGVAVDIIECDAKAYDPYEYKGTYTGKIHGRGGTDFQPVIDYYEKNRKMYSTLIYFTDGECTPPTKPRNPMLWVISSTITEYGRTQFDKLPWFKFIIPKGK
jgi:predicted metal-dependent peptidase